MQRDVYIALSEELKNKLLVVFKGHLVNYPTPLTLNYGWSFGSLSGIFVMVQFITGLLLACHYISDILVAFENMEYIMRDVHYGWLLRYMHSNSASFFFICMYCHIFRGLFYKSFSFPRHKLWNSGVLILIVSILVSFIGYVLPWGQMSFWGATVITNLATAVPKIGGSLVIALWGGFTIEGATLIRFFNFHYILAIILLGLIFIHLVFLHEVGSSNPLGISRITEISKFYRFFVLKDIASLFIAFFAYFFIVFYYPNLLGHSDNYIKANPLVTPTHIVPEWYFLPFYAILRSIDNKFIGVVAMLLSIIILVVLPLCTEYIKDTKFIYGESNLFFWAFVVISITLWFVGGLPAEFPYVDYGRFFTKCYFILFVFYYFHSVVMNKYVMAHRFVINHFEIKDPFTLTK